MKFVYVFLVVVSILGSANGANIYVNASAINDYTAVAAGRMHSLGLKCDGSIAGWGYNFWGQATPPAGNDYIAIAVGTYHSLAIRSNGTIAGWGRNDFGQATPPSGNDYIAIAAGQYHSIALKSDGSIVEWGGWGPPPPAGNDYIAISAGYEHSIALKSDGTIVAWGSDEFGQATPPTDNGYIKISSGSYHCLALKSDGSIAAWGRNVYGEATPPAGNNYTAVSAGGWHSLALKTDGSIAAWGDISYSQVPPPAGTDYIKIAAGSVHSLAIKSNGSIVAWGYNGFGESTPPAGGANNGSSWLDAFIDLQDALDAAVSTDTILVAAGTYYPSAQIIPGNSRSAVFSLKNGVTILGGFAATGEPGLSDRNPQLYKTILSGDLGKNDGPGFTNRSDNCYHVLFADAAKALNNTAILDGFTISGGQADGSSPHNAGGGMYNYSSSPKIINCTFTNNQGGVGGAVFNQSCSLSPKFINSIIAANNVTHYGGGMANFTASPSLVNCAVYGNYGAVFGGGFYNSGSAPVLTNCIVWANTNGVTPTPNQIYDSGVTTTATYCDIQGGHWGIGNINTDPYFVNAGGNDFHLQYDSACIDAGLNSAVTVTNDFEMETRICHSNVDMGPDEVLGYAIAASAEPVAGGTVVFDPDYTIFASGTEVSVQAVANSGYVFDHWSGALSGSANPASLTITDDMSVTAYFTFIGEIIYVDAGSSAVEPNGASWEYAFKDLEPALAAAGPSNQIWVAKGTYYPTRVISVGYPRSAAYQLKNGVPVFGGFDGTEDRATFDLDSRDFDADETILNADIGLPGFDIDNAYHVFLHPADLALNASALIDGFTITAANADGGLVCYGGDNGGGMYNDNASPTIRNCKFMNNKAKYGGGMYNLQSSPVIMNCMFLNNSSQQSAGAMSNPYSSPIISGCVFRGNSAVTAAGGIWNESGTATITDCVFEENVTASGGGIYNGYGGNAIIENCSFISNTGNGVFNSNCSPAITRCLFRGNTRNWGPGMANQTASPKISNCLFIENGTTSSTAILYNYFSSAPVVVNCTFANNTISPGGLIYNDESSLIMTNSIVWGNNYNNITNMNGSYAVVTYTDFQGGYGGTGNININPMFTDTAGDDYHLQSGSQCIDVGNDSTVPEDIAGDMDGTTRIIDGNCDAVARVDMGCYEFSRKWLGDLNDDCRVNMPDIAILSNYWETNSAQADIAPGYGDGFVDILDLAKIAANWLADYE